MSAPTAFESDHYFTQAEFAAFVDSRYRDLDRYELFNGYPKPRVFTEDETLESEVLPGFQVRIGDLFPA